MHESTTQHRRKLTTPVKGVRDVDGAWIRPAELLVDLDRDGAVERRLRDAGGEPYSPEKHRGNWRHRRGVPKLGDINERMRRAELNLELWVGFSDGVPERLVLEERLPGLHFNHVFFGEDFYQGGPGGTPQVVTGPPTLSTTECNPTPDIAVVDTGVPQDWKTIHPELTDAILEVGDWIDLVDNLPADGHRDHQGGHGIFIAGVIARLAPQLDIQVVRTLSTTGETDDASLSVALDDTTAPVINLSLGGYTVNNLPSVALDAMIQNLVDQGRIVVAAAGNANGAKPGTPFYKRPFYPASLAHPGVISVGAVDTTSPTLVLWDHTNEGTIYAPGVDLLSTYIAGLDSFAGWASWTGTSFATPVVAARIAELIAEPHTGTTLDVVDTWRSSSELADTDPAWTNIDPARVYVPKVTLTNW
jgi:hypothetical protein